MSDQLGLEAALRRLEEIVESLERQELELEDALRLFDEGMTLIKGAEKKLAESEGRLQQILIDQEEREQKTDPDAGE